MGYLCDFCGDQRSMVYCRSDAACLCLSCDRNVHSANALSRRHSRTLLCEKCNSQPAFIRCSEEKISLCQNCDWVGHGGSSTGSTHKRLAVSCYSGCPSAAELSTIWSFVLDMPTVGASTVEQDLGSMSISNDNQRSNSNAPENNCGLDASVIVEKDDSKKADNSGVTMDKLAHQPDESANAASPKISIPGRDLPAAFDDDGFYEDFTMDEVDLSIESYKEFFGGDLDNTEQLFEDGWIDGLFGMETSSAKSKYQGTCVAKGPSTGRVNALAPAYSIAESADDSVMSSRTEPTIFLTRQSNLSFSGLTGESSAGDHQDCGISPGILMGEPPWVSPSYTSANRSDAVMRYKEKKKNRKFEKRVRYVSRKERADVRRRVKGRFVKAGDAYDYDPLSQTRSF